MPDTHLVTAEELERLPDDDYRYELVAGRVIRMSPVGYLHGKVVAKLFFLLMRHVRAEDLGAVVTEVGFTLASDPDTVRAPDVAFIARHRIPSPEPRGFWKGPPDVAIEVLSPDDRLTEVRAKIEEYLAHGVRAVVIVDPDDSSVAVHRASRGVVTLYARDELNLDDVVAGFRCAVDEILR